jgi:catechol 2,3-dioxygenase-like lactoylglutathione lyase family enzyme
MAVQPTTTTRDEAPPVYIPVLHHVNLKTKRLQDMIDWYGIVVGTTPVHQFPGGAWLSNDDANHRIALLSPAGLADDPDKLTHAGLHHTAFEYASMQQLLDTFERLAGQDIRPHACLDHGMTTSFYYVDPDGNSVELQSDNFGAWSASKEFMLSDPRFSENPIGVSVDPKRMLVAWRAGASTDELHERAYAGEFTPDEPLDLRIALG